MGALETRIGAMRMRTPLVAVSGIFGTEYATLPSKLVGVGAVVTKTITLKPRSGNPEPRIVETPAGLLNSIGLQNPGIKRFLSEDISELRLLEVPVISSIAGSTIEEYAECASLLAARDEVEAIELNVSCPNVEKGGMEFGCDPKTLGHLVAKVRQAVGRKTLITKLTPNVTDIAVPAQAAVDNGTDAISLINTLRAMSIDINTWKPKLGNRVGGLSGPAIHPVAVYMVSRCYTVCCQRSNIPIIGIGGVTTGEDAVELILAGATCVGIGTAMFRDQYQMNKEQSIFQRIGDYLLGYLETQGIPDLSGLIGKAVAKA